MQWSSLVVQRPAQIVRVRPAGLRRFGIDLLHDRFGSRFELLKAPLRGLPLQTR